MIVFLHFNVLGARELHPAPYGVREEARFALATQAKGSPVLQPIGRGVPLPCRAGLAEPAPLEDEERMTTVPTERARHLPGRSGYTRGGLTRTPPPPFPAGDSPLTARTLFPGQEREALVVFPRGRTRNRGSGSEVGEYPRMAVI